MNHAEIGTRFGLSLLDLECLIKGKATNSVATRLKLTPQDVEDLIKGKVSQAVTTRLGLHARSAAEELATSLQPEGVIGMIVGLLLSANHS